MTGLFADAYVGRRVLVTGHTGFKGSWLALWLSALGADVRGLALPPESSPNHWDLLELDIPGREVDVRDAAAVAGVLDETQPEIVFHLAAQALVRRSYRDPLASWATNVMGTAHVLEACRRVPSVRAILVVGTDKVYANREWPWGYREVDPLGGHDPYSASKAAAELVAESYRNAFFGVAGAPLLATARAGNVIGGGDWAEDRLIPDLVRALSRGRVAEIRSPQATRPWQHVLECLAGYLLLGQRLLNGERASADAWNFGPAAEDNRSVETVLALWRRQWPELNYVQTGEAQPHEANLLYVDSAKARARLGWRPVWSLAQGVSATAAWYRRYFADGTVCSREQLAAYVAAARSSGNAWAGA